MKKNSISFSDTSIPVDQPLWSYNDLSKYLGRSVNTLRKDVMHRRIPFIKIGKLIRFNPDAIALWLQEKQSDNIAEI
jgi:excisionase family DNA binding protein